MLYALYLIFLIGGIILVGISFALPAFQGLVFMLGVLVIAAAVAVPITAGAIEHRR